MYLQCDMCNKWSHLECVGITNKEADSIDCWFCEVCEKYNDQIFNNNILHVKDTLSCSQNSSMLERKTNQLMISTQKGDYRDKKTKSLKDSDHESEDAEGNYPFNNKNISIGSHEVNDHTNNPKSPQDFTKDDNIDSESESPKKIYSKNLNVLKRKIIREGQEKDDCNAKNQMDA
mmetsp:Transcript_22402/g.18676  ORF Transcript_22402/g.18676 Transcript_22402/m.18676 type:complete len:175 (-) Transcript_22402:20-544(-)